MYPNILPSVYLQDKNEKTEKNCRAQDLGDALIRRKETKEQKK
jgi:hypothetical protein